MTYCNIAKIELVQIEDLYLSSQRKETLLCILYITLYFYSLYIGSVLEWLLVSSRLFIGSYFSFRLFFYMERQKEDSDFMEKFYFLSFFHTLYAFILDDYEKSKEKNGDDQPIDENIISTSKRWFSRNSTIAYIFLYRENCIVRNDIKYFDKKCDHILYSLGKSHRVESLHIEKNMIFALNERKPFFFYASQEFFGKITSKCYNFYKKLDYF